MQLTLEVLKFIGQFFLLEFVLNGEALSVVNDAFVFVLEDFKVGFLFVEEF